MNGIGLASRNPRVSAHEVRAQHRTDTAAAIERYAARSRALREGGGSGAPDAQEQQAQAAPPGRNARPERRDIDMEMELELSRRRRAAHREARHAALDRSGGAEMQRRHAATGGMYSAFGDRPPPNCPAQAVLVWMGCQVLILMDIVRVPSNCVQVGSRAQCIVCELGADLDYSSCALPWPGASPEAPGISFAETTALDFYNECCTGHPECCTPSPNYIPSHRNYAFMGQDDSSQQAMGTNHDSEIKAVVNGVPCCDALCGAAGTDATMTSAELEAKEFAENFYCDGFTVWYISYVLVYIVSVIVVGNAARVDGSASACLTLTLGIIVLYWVRTEVVPYGSNRHTFIYPAVQFFEYAVMSDLFLWMMTRRARAMRLHYERSGRHVGRVEDLEAARQRDRDELDRAAERLAQQPIEPLPPVKPVERGAVGAIIEGIAMEDMDAEDRQALGQVAMTANPMMRASVSVGDVVEQCELQRVPDDGAGVGVGHIDEEDGGGTPLPLHVTPSAVVVQQPSRTGGVARTCSNGAPVMTVMARLTPAVHSSTSDAGVVEGIVDPATRTRVSMAAVEDDAGDDMV